MKVKSIKVTFDSSPRDHVTFVNESGSNTIVLSIKGSVVRYRMSYLEKVKNFFGRH